ncbi:MAG TPA: hypothetical protein VG322_06910 [Candidatus Acidoferrales bacterium]|jgi:hypothetical protein|nr:hypothetical protein [Candidatus Acidoferrales bacterium]
MSKTDIREVVQDAINHYGAGIAVTILATDGTVLHSLQGRAPEGQNQGYTIGDVDRAAFEQANNAALEQARQAYLKRAAEK